MSARGRGDSARGSGAGTAAAVARAVDRIAAVSRDAEAAREALMRDARDARAALNRAREELRRLTAIPVTPEEEHAWLELERRSASVS